MYCGARRASPPPWSIEERPPDACFIVRDHSGQALAYVYLESLRLFREEERAAGAERPKLLTRDEAQRIAADIAKPPELLSRPQY